MVAMSGRSDAVTRANSSPNTFDWSYVHCRPSGNSTCRPEDPLVFTKHGSSRSSHNPRIALATRTTCSNGASLGCKSRMHQSGCSNDESRLDYTLTVIDSETFTEPLVGRRNWVWVPGEAVEPWNCFVESE